MASVLILGIGLGLGIVRELVLAVVSDEPQSLGPFGELMGPARTTVTKEMWLTVGVMAGFQLLQVVITEVFQLGIVGMAIRLTRNEPAALGEVGRQAKKIWKSLVQQFLVFLVTMLVLSPSLACVIAGVFFDQPLWLAAAGLSLVLSLVPLVYLMLGFSFAREEIVLSDDCGPIEGLQRSWRIVRGRRIDVLTVGLINVGLALIGLLLCCIGTVVTTPLSLMYSTVFFLAMRDGSDVDDAVAAERIC